MFSGRPGDIRGMGLMLGVAGLVVVVIWYVTSLVKFDEEEGGL